MIGLTVGTKFSIGQWRYEVISNDGKGDCAIRLINGSEAPKEPSETEPEEAPQEEESKFTKPFTKKKG